MKFIDRVKNALHLGANRTTAQRDRLAQATPFNSYAAEAQNDDAILQEGRPGATAYDRAMWTKKLRYLLTDKLPIDKKQWDDFIADAAALGFESAWIEGQQRAAFDQLLRKFVADGLITGEEHHHIDLARDTIGLSEKEAGAMLDRAVADIERELGHDVVDESKS